MTWNNEIRQALEKSVLCWLATVDNDLQPSVSPKEIFTYHNDKVIIANIASPNSLKNITKNNKVCISFVDILVQKGYKLYGECEILIDSHPTYEASKIELEKMTGGQFSFDSIFSITITKIKEIVAPRYIINPETTEADQIAAARKQYGL